MNFSLYFLVALALPMLICCYDIGLVGQMAAKLAHDNLVAGKTDEDFKTKIVNCASKVANTNDYMQCLETEVGKMHGIENGTEPKAQCCGRVVSYICMKKFLTSKCGVSKEEVESHDDEHFNFWNDLNVPNFPGHCKGGKQKSIDYCHSYDTANKKFEINQAAIRVAEVGPTDNEFETKLRNCYVKISNKDFYSKCLKEELSKLKAINGTSSPKMQCCERVVNYICLKSFLTPKCDMPKQEVDGRDEEHFRFWNDIEIPGYPNHCSGDSKKSITYCHTISTANPIIGF